jgi:hypothetical protein
MPKKSDEAGGGVCVYLDAPVYILGVQVHFDVRYREGGGYLVVGERQGDLAV